MNIFSTSCEADISLLDLIEYRTWMNSCVDFMLYLLGDYGVISCFIVFWGQAAAGIGLHVNAHKTEYMSNNQTGDITTLDGTSLKLVDKFTYLGSCFSSTEKDIDTRLTKAWTTIDRLSIIWKSDLNDKMKRSFFQAAVVSILLYGCTTWTLTNWLEKITQECCEQYWTSPGGNTPQGTNYTVTCLPSRKLSKLDEPDMQVTAGEAGTCS